MDREPHWLGLRFRGSSGDDLATRVHATLAGAGIILDPGRISYIASVMFGEGLDDLHCGYCGHRGVRHTWGVDAGLTGPSPWTIPTATTAPRSGTPPWWSVTSALAEGPQGRVLSGLFGVTCLCRKGSRCEGVHH